MDRPQMKRLRYVTMLRLLLEFSDIHGCWKSMHKINLLQIWVTPLALYRQTKKFTAGAFTCIFCGLNTTPYLWATYMRFHRWASCSACVTMYGDVISNSDTSRALFKELGHLLLEDVL